MSNITDYSVDSVLQNWLSKDEYKGYLKGSLFSKAANLCSADSPLKEEPILYEIEKTVEKLVSKNNQEVCLKVKKEWYLWVFPGTTGFMPAKAKVWAIWDGKPKTNYKTHYLLSKSKELIECDVRHLETWEYTWQDCYENYQKTSPGIRPWRALFSNSYNREKEVSDMYYYVEVLKDE